MPKCSPRRYLPEREPLQLPCEPLLLPRLSPRVRMEIPEKLLALVTGGRSVRLELSESVLLQGRGSKHFMSLSVLLWRLLDARLELSRFPLRGNAKGGMGWNKGDLKKKKKRSKYRARNEEDRKWGWEDSSQSCRKTGWKACQSKEVQSSRKQVYQQCHRMSFRCADSQHRCKIQIRQQATWQEFGFEKTFNHNLSEPRVRTHTRKQTEEHMQRENNTKYAPDEHQTTWQWHRMRRHLHKQSKTGGHNQVMKRKLCRQLMARLSNWIQWNLQFGCLFVCQNMLSKELLFYK